MKQKNKEELKANEVNILMDEIFDRFANKSFSFNEEIEAIFSKLNQECTKGQENDLVQLIKGYKHLYKGELLEAILAVDAILMNKTLDPHSIFNARNVLNSVHADLLQISKENIEDQRILPVAEALYIRGLLGLDAQELLALHFDATGHDEKAKNLRNNITKLMPNYLSRKAG